mmetsp:Transcript_22558/g.76260  ORF Transcript_22558/g.76260 Transcript_22558/m.76260 type:complete len:144 (+) Transcript_22558:229-660(+)
MACGLIDLGCFGGLGEYDEPDEIVADNARPLELPRNPRSRASSLAAAVPQRCATCKISCSSNAAFQEHLKTSRHRELARLALREDRRASSEDFENYVFQRIQNHRRPPEGAPQPFDGAQSGQEDIEADDADPHAGLRARRSLS